MSEESRSLTQEQSSALKTELAKIINGADAADLIDYILAMVVNGIPDLLQREDAVFTRKTCVLCTTDTATLPHASRVGWEINKASRPRPCHRPAGSVVLHQAVLEVERLGDGLRFSESELPRESIPIIVNSGERRVRIGGTGPHTVASFQRKLEDFNRGRGDLILQRSSLTSAIGGISHT